MTGLGMFWGGITFLISEVASNSQAVGPRSFLHLDWDVPTRVTRVMLWREVLDGLSISSWSSGASYSSQPAGIMESQPLDVFGKSVTP